MRGGGVVRIRVDEVENVDRWRRAARRAGRLLGWHVRTATGWGWVYVSSDNWQPPPGADRDAAERVAPITFREPGSPPELTVVSGSDAEPASPD